MPNLYRVNKYRIGYWLLFLIPFCIHVSLALFVWSQQAGAMIDNSWEHTLFLLKFVWFLPVLWMMFNFLGLLFGNPADISDLEKAETENEEDDLSRLLIIAYVSKGENREALRRSIEESQAVADKMGVSYEIEVVTDFAVPEEFRVPETNGPIYYYLVPNSYQTRRRVKYKARALQYLLGQRTKRLQRRRDEGSYVQDTWIMHCDEETVLTSQVIIGSETFMRKYSLTHCAGAIGQGEILYNEYNYGKSLLITAIDSVRTGDDLGRFRFQYKVLHRSVFGIHGSFVLVPAEIERAIGWDWGRKSDITEDTYFAFRAMEEGVTFDWVDGFVKEQSPFTVSDIIEQRARWYTGLSLIVSEGDLSFLNRLLLALFLLSWTFAWLGSLVTILSISTAIFGVDNHFPLWATVISATIAGVFGSVYMVGVYRNLRYVQLAWYRKVTILAATYFLWFVQIVPFVEAVAVLYAVYRALFNPLTTFYVVKKDAAPAS